MRAGVGGTFNVIHKGHELLFETAFAVADEVEIGLTSDEFARRIKAVPITPYVQRKLNLERFLARYGRPFEIVKIDGPMGTAATSEKLDVIVVSPETMRSAEGINDARQSKGLRPLRIVCIREVRAEDANTISSSRVIRGDIDKDGRLLRPLRVTVGSTNKVKLDAVRNIFVQVFGLAEVTGVEPEDSRPRQPLEEKTIEGAVRRAKLALERSDADYGAGIEAGLFYSDALGRYLDVQYCAIVDRAGKMTVGHGPGFEYPPEVVRAVLEGKAVGDTMSQIAGIENIGRKMGSIGYLSDGMIDRTSLTEIAVLMALIPRIRKELYEPEGQACSHADTASR